MPVLSGSMQLDSLTYFTYFYGLAASRKNHKIKTKTVDPKGFEPLTSAM
jgi:hypothetical protein